MRYRRSLCGALLVALAACSSGGRVPTVVDQTIPHGVLNGVEGPPWAGVRPLVVGPRRYKIGVFVRGDSKRYNPDPIVWQNGDLFVAYQNKTQPTGTGGDSTVVQYRHDGKIVQSIKVKGRCDGMRWNPYAKRMWLTVNEDANSSMYTWDPGTRSLRHYAFSSAKHGGGYDDLAFANGKAFIAASNPKLNSKGLNKGPAVISVVLKGRVAEVTPVLMGNAKAKDLLTGKRLRLNLTDPDSLIVAPNGDVLLVSQADEEIVFLRDAGKPSQKAAVLSVGTQLDDTAYATRQSGVFLVADQKKNAIFYVQGAFQTGSLWSETPDDSGVKGFVGKVNVSTGQITPVFTGFGSPTGLTFVPNKP